MEKQVVKYNVDKAVIAKMADIYMHLKIDDLDDKAQFEMVHSARMVMVKHRARVDKIRVAGNKEANEFIRGNNKAAVVLVALMAPIEAHLTAEEKPVIEKEKREKALKAEAIRVITQDRVDQLQAVGYVVSFDKAGSYTINDFLRLLEAETLWFESEKEKLAQEEADRKAEDDRLKKAKAAQDAEAERLNRKNEKMRVEQKEYDDKQEALRVEREAEISRQIKAGADRLRIAQKKIDDEKAELEAEKDRIKAAKEAEEAEEVAKFLANEKAEADAKRKEQEAIDKKVADEKVERAKQATIDRRAAEAAEVRPDIEKLKLFGKFLLDITSPALKDHELRCFLSDTLHEVHELGKTCLNL